MSVVVTFIAIDLGHSQFDHAPLNLDLLMVLFPMVTSLTVNVSVHHSLIIRKRP